MTLAPSETSSVPSPPAGHGPPLRLLPRVVAVALLVLAAGFYLHGLRHSPLLWPPAAPPDSGLAANHEAGNEELLARSYWMRYRDIRLDRHWGETGAMGIAGPRHHYRQHGQREGRIFAPLVIPDDLETEAVLAESRSALAGRHYKAYAEQAALLAILGEDLAEFYETHLEK